MFQKDTWWLTKFEIKKNWSAMLFSWCLFLIFYFFVLQMIGEFDLPLKNHPSYSFTFFFLDLCLFTFLTFHFTRRKEYYSTSVYSKDEITHEQGYYRSHPISIEQVIGSQLLHMCLFLIVSMVTAGPFLYYVTPLLQQHFDFLSYVFMLLIMFAMALFITGPILYAESVFSFKVYSVQYALWTIAFMLLSLIYRTLAEEHWFSPLITLAQEKNGIVTGLILICSFFSLLIFYRLIVAKIRNREYRTIQR
ncbi:hypothetical protein [Hazenella coriacea]|uniref:ABC-2 family transporter n=1 Tax=Hazenella coriacea TaxID=1179467 RepID=A0A4R3L4H4_9BACL|nr:hypothetical protein [Hazenella coriacea]TCS94202.1 hypothetical protein EDD58_10468 [Hazenella coriacea]